VTAHLMRWPRVGIVHEPSLNYILIKRLSLTSDCLTYDPQASWLMSVYCNRSILR